MALSDAELQFSALYLVRFASSFGFKSVLTLLPDHVDVPRANLALLETDAADGEAMNVGSSDTVEIRTSAEEVRDQLAPELELVFGERNDADAEQTHADVSKARELIEYEPARSIREGVGEFIEWYRENRDWYEELVLAS